MARLINYIFDVDGTLTPSRLKMDKEFAKFFRNWIANKQVYLLTGSDHDKTIEQQKKAGARAGPRAGKARSDRKL